MLLTGPKPPPIITTNDVSANEETKMKHRVCPVWIGYFLASPVRKLIQDPLRILGPYVKPGMKVVDIGSAMGFFSLTMAKLVGAGGRVVCVDMQAKMLKGLTRRAQRAGLVERIETRTCTAESLSVEDLAGRMDFALAFAVVHETPDPAHFLGEATSVLRAGGRLLIAEPKGHVSEAEFRKTVTIAENAGLRMVDSPRIPGSHAALMEKS